MSQINVEELTQKVKEEYLSQVEQDAAANAEATKTLKDRKRLLLGKVIFMTVVAALILASLVYFGVAWYTRVTSTHAVTFEVADYELAINDNTDDEFIVNVYDYNNVRNDSTEKTMAPGTAGYIPLRMSARHSDINVNYSIVFKNRMPEELQKHIRFFYLVNKSDGKPVVCDLEHTEGSTDSVVKESDRWKFISDPEAQLDARVEKKYFNLYPADIAEGNKDAMAPFTIAGELLMDTEKMIYIYWEWYLDADTAKSTHSTLTAPTGVTWADYCDQWNELDTDMGRYPKKYYESMYIHLTCVGIQTVPELEKKN